MNKDLLDDRWGRFWELPVALTEYGHSVHGICLSYRKKDNQLLTHGSVHWESINAGRMKSGLIRFVARSFRAAGGADIIWAGSDSFYGIIGCFLGNLRRKPVIFDIYDNFDEFFIGKLPVARQLYHWAIKRCEAITTFSSPFREYLNLNFRKGREVHVIENAVRQDLFRPIDPKKCRQILGLPESAKIIGTAGALTEEREVHLLLKAFQALSEVYNDLHLAVAGPRDRKFLIPASANVHDFGVLDFANVPVFLNALDVAVVCYADDDFGKYCFPQKTREMMACDIPIVAADVGSLSILFRDRPEWLYKPGSWESLKAVIENRLSDRRTDYEKSPAWGEMAQLLDRIILALV
jgi:glycosyltransferase involved in cell wall biosynthesis